MARKYQHLARASKGYPLWRKIVVQKNQEDESRCVHRKYFELCVLSEVARELQSGDLYVRSSEQYGDYREQLIGWDTFESQVADYGAMLMLPTESGAFVAQHRQRLLYKGATA